MVRHKGYGFGKVPTGEIVFILAGVVHGGEVLMIGMDAWVQVVNDEARAEGGKRARNARGRNAWKEEKDREKANRVAQQVTRAEGQRFLQPQHRTRNPAGYDAVRFCHGLSVLPLASTTVDR